MAPKKGTKQSPETIAKRVEKNTGKKRTPEQCERMRLAQLERHHIPSEETRARIGAGNKGKKRTPEQCKQNSESHKGYKKTPEAIEKTVVAHRGKKLSEETRKKISDALKGRKQSPEQIAKNAAARVGLKRSPEAIAKTTAKNKGKKRSEEIRKMISIMRRNPSDETRKKMSESHKGDKCCMWKGGISFFPYCPKFSREFRERVRENYGRVCVECGKTEEENGKKLSVHHVLYNKQSCCDDSKPLFVALCSSCHSKTNGNREYWEEHFTNIINEKYGGKCYYTKEEIIMIKQEV